MSAPLDYRQGKFGRSDGLVVILKERRARYSQILRQIIFQNDSHAARGIKR